MSLVIKISNTTIKTPSGFLIERYNITKSGRVASGKMVMELIAKKRKFNFTYNTINGDELNTILSLIDGNNLFFQLSYQENGIDKAATVYAGAIPSNLYRASDSWIWTDVLFSLIEQ